MVLAILETEDMLNPLDAVEDVLASHDWMFSRMADDQITLQFQGRNATYHVVFDWQAGMKAVHFKCTYDMFVHPENDGLTAAALRQINARLWLGHFDVPPETGVPTFRHTTLLRGGSIPALSQAVEDMVDIALTECEHYFPLFHILSECGGAVNMADLSLALMDVAGES